MKDSSTFVYGLKKICVQVTARARKNGEALNDFRLIDPAILFDGGCSSTTLILSDIAIAISHMLAERDTQCFVPGRNDSKESTKVNSRRVISALSDFRVGDSE